MSARKGALGLFDDGAAIHVSRSGYWTRILGCSGVCVKEFNFWVDLEVRNDAFEKEVGILWTKNGWASFETAMASYEATLPSGRERWGVDVRNIGNGIGNLPGSSYDGRGQDVQYAAFVRMNGETHWDPHNDHWVFETTSFEQPVRLLRSSLSAKDGQPVLEGRVRTYDLGYEKRVTLRYTTDGWSSFSEAPATWAANDDFTFAIPLEVDSEVTEEVRFAIRYQVRGETFWDDNRGSDYRHRLAPDITENRVAASALPASGVLAYRGSVSTALPVERFEVSLDGAPYVPVGEPGRRSFRYAFSTASLEDGSHRFRFRVVGAAGFVRESEEVPLEVESQLEPLVDRWSPHPDEEGQTPWEVVTALQGEVFVMFSGPNRVARYAGWGGPLRVRFEPPPFDGRLVHFAVTPAGEVYGATSIGDQVVRWHSDGTLDAGFGGGGVLELDGEVGSSTLCNLGPVEANAERFFVVDTCNARVLAFDLDGTLVDELAVPRRDDRRFLLAAHLDGTDLWLGHSGVSGDDLVRVDAAGELEIAERIILDGIDVKSLLPARDGGFWVLDFDNLYRLGADGSVVSRWEGGNFRDVDLTGAFDLPNDLLPHPDGGVAVLSVEDRALVPFAPRP